MKLNNEMTDMLLPDDIQQEVKDHRKERERILEFRELYKGNHPILFSPKPRHGGGADNREVKNFFLLTIDTKVGYMTGEPILITADKSDEVENVLDAILEGNNFPHLITRVVKDMCVVGKAHIILFQDKDGMTRFKKVPAEEMIVYRNREGNIYMAIRYHYRDNIIDRVSRGKRLYVEVYREDYTYYYLENDRGKLMQHREPELNIYNGVPVIEFLNNEEGTSDIEPIESLNDTYNKILSNMIDEIEDIRNYFLVFRGMIGTEKELEMFNRMRAIFLPDKDADVDFLVKDPKTESTERQLDRIEESIYELAQVPNFKDEKFGGNKSGVAMLYKMSSMENNAMTKELEIRRALNTLLTTISPVLELKTGESFGVKDYTIKFKRTMPMDMSIEEIIKLYQSGMLDEKTAIGLLPFIDDASSVIEMKKEEEAERYGINYVTENHRGS